MAVLEQQKPERVFHYFEEICGIPRGSGNTRQISDYLVRFAQEHGLAYEQDDLGNVILIGEASEGYEAEPPVILQGHMDMVAVKKLGASICMEREGLRLALAGDFVYAIDTSLGGDDGIAVAFALALLEDPQIRRPRLEAVITVDEEVGMQGASGIDLSRLRGRRMINLDSEEEGMFLTSCAGGGRVKVSLPVSFEPQEGTLFRLEIDGLLGGHSGSEIHRGRGNANVLLGRLLHRIAPDIALTGLEGGTADNAIPRRAQAAFLALPGRERAVEEALTQLAAQVRRELAGKDDGVRIHWEKQDGARRAALARGSMDRATALLFLQPDGVQAMSASLPGLVQTSLNLGIVRLTERALTLDTSVRSSLESERDALIAKLEELAALCGAAAEVSGLYPAWEYRPQSPLREKMTRVYRRLYGSDPVIEAIHAGLECGILAGKIPELDCVSIGPNIENIHTTEERLSISSVCRVWEFLVQVLEEKEDEA